MIPKELLKKIKHIEISTTRLVNDLFGGEYESVFKGQGIEFADVREYVPGDDIRSIDWNVTARSQKTYIKKFVETREMTVIFMVDMSGSQYFGTGQRLKAEVAAEITSLLAFAAVKNNDKTGMLICTDEVEKFIPVKKGRSHVLRVIREILYYKPKRTRTSLNAGFQYLHNFLRRTAIIFVISDFLDTGFRKSLKILSRKHDVVAVHLKDRREGELPNVGLLDVRDPETGETILVDTGSKKVRNSYKEQAARHQHALDTLFKQLGIDKVEISAEGSYVEPLMKFFKLREKRL